ncbi:MAG: putative hydrolase, alpha/beta fold family [Mucilaginibacter sp.]|nr:putative hydrolase, alpha/beta fold family [Mucilaginibacter sp.]
MNAFNHIIGKFYNTGDANIYYEITGNKEGPVILLLHGGFGTIEDFNPIMPVLNEKYCVIGIDSQGHGKSSLGTKKLSYEIMQKDIQSLLQHLNIQKLSIIGFSDGGITTYRLAVFNPLNIEKMVTIGSRWHVNDALRSEELFLKLTPESWKNKFPEMVTLYQKLNPEPDFDHLFSEVIGMWLDKGKSGYPNEQLKQLACPLLIVRGDQDHLISGKSVADLAGLVKNSMLLSIPFAGHAAFKDQPEIFKISLQLFLN